MIPALPFFALLFLSVAGYAVAALALVLARRNRRGCRLPGFEPPISIVKPLAGLDDQLEANLESFYRLEYREYEVIFSFASRTDEAFGIARRVADRHTGVPTVFVVDAREPGANSKINRLAPAIRRARYRHILLADGNVRVHREFLIRAISWFADPSVGLVSHLFRAGGARTLGSRLESLHLNGALRAGTNAMAQILGMPCVVGKSILVCRDALNAIGGIEALRDHLAEDYLLGKLVAGAGYRVLLSADEIETAEVSRSLLAAWSRQRRWAILRKRLGGVGYAAELLASPLPWFVATLAAGGGALAAPAAGLYLLRIALEARLCPGEGKARSLVNVLLVPLRDLGVAALFWAGLFGRRTSWRGRPLVVGPRTLILGDSTRGSPTGRLGAQIAEQN